MSITKTKKLTKKQVEQIRVWLNVGRNTVFIQQALHVSSQQVAAVKAHLTMGTYN